MNKEVLKEMREAVISGQLDTVKGMLARHKGLADVSTIFGTWLHVAAKHGQMEIVKYLLDIGMDVNAKGDTFGGNPLRSAVSRGHLDIVKFLYEHGAELDDSEPEVNPLFGAIPGGHVEIAKFLIDAGIDLSVSYPVGQLEECNAYEWARQWGQTEVKNYIGAKMEEQGIERKEAIYLMKGKDGKTVRVPESQREAWEQARREERKQRRQKKKTP